MDTNQQLESQKQELIATLSNAADSLRKAAIMADGLAANLKHVPVASGNNDAVGAMQLFAQLFNSGAFNHSANLQHLSASAPAPSPPALNDGASHEQKPVPKKRKRADSIAEKDKKVKEKKEKVVKDPNAPKRPASAYILFQNDVREEVKKNNPDMPYSVILHKISEIWSSLSPEDKQPYIDKVSIGKIEYEKKKETYDAKQLATANGKEAEGSETESPAEEITIPETSENDSPNEASEESSDEEEKTRKAVKKSKSTRKNGVDVPATPSNAGKVATPSGTATKERKKKDKEKKKKGDA